MTFIGFREYAVSHFRVQGGEGSENPVLQLPLAFRLTVLDLKSLVSYRVRT